MNRIAEVTAVSAPTHRLWFRRGRWPEPWQPVAAGTPAECSEALDRHSRQFKHSIYLTKPADEDPNLEEQ